MKLKAHLEKLNDPRGLQGQDYRLWSILALTLVGYSKRLADGQANLPRSSRYSAQKEGDMAAAIGRNRLSHHQLV